MTLKFNNEVVAILAKDIYDYVYKESLETGDNQHIVCPCGVKKDCRITGCVDIVREDAGDGYTVIAVHRDPLFRSPNVCECPISSDATAKINEELAKLLHKPMSVIYNEYAPSARPHVAETQGYTKYYDHIEYSHNVFFMAIDELMRFYEERGMIRRDRARVGHKS